MSSVTEWPALRLHILHLKYIIALWTFQQPNLFEIVRLARSSCWRHLHRHAAAGVEGLSEPPFTPGSLALHGSLKLWGMSSFILQRCITLFYLRLSINKAVICGVHPLTWPMLKDPSTAWREVVMPCCELPHTQASSVVKAPQDPALTSTRQQGTCSKPG